MIQKDVAKRVCSRASVRPSSARLPLGIDGRAANFGVKVRLGLTRLFSRCPRPLDMEGGGGTMTKRRSEVKGLCSEGFNGRPP